MSHSALAHHFDDLKQQHEAATLGMWAFLITEIMFFGGLFTGFMVYHHAYPEAFHAASLELDWILGSVNTTVLLCSSLTMAMAVHAARMSRRRATTLFLLATVVLGCIFLGIKGAEYSHKFHENLVPGPSFQFDPGHGSGTEAAAHAPAGGAAAGRGTDHFRGAQLFFSFYFVMTGVHAAHMLIGVGVIVFLIVQASRRRVLGDRSNIVEMTGLYWHFVDIVWIYLFPLLYLIDRT